MKTLKRYCKLFYDLAKIYFSKATNKNIEYRRIIFYTLKDWGGVYIKFLQILAGTSKFLDGWGGPREMQVFAQAPQESLNVGQWVNIDAFNWISDTPVAAGSFALVYRGRLQSGEDVAIKILRPSIRNNLNHDLKVLRRLCKILSHLLPRYLVDYNEAYEACARMFVLETDYTREVANQNYFAQFYKNHPRIVIPKVFAELSNQNVIVQDFIEGPTLADIMSNRSHDVSAAALTKKLTGSNLWEQITLVGGEALCTAMCADYIYGDPHPGNIILLPDNRIALIDFGVIASKPASHWSFYEWVKSYYNILDNNGDFKTLLETTVACFCPDLSIAMRRCNFKSGNLLAILSSAMEEKLNCEMSGNVSYVETFKNGHLLDVFLKVVSTKVIDVKIDMVNFELLKAMQAFLGSITILDNAEGNHDFSQLMYQSMQYAINRSRNIGIPNDVVNSSHYSMTDSYELLVQTISNLANNDEFMFNLVKERIFA